MSPQLTLDVITPDFELQDANFVNVKLSQFRGKYNVVLIFMRGLVCPFCRSHLAQLGQDTYSFTQKNAVILAVGPDGQHTFKRYWLENNLQFYGLTDVKSKVAALYQQEADVFELGKMPAIFILDKEGIIRYVHYGDSMSDIPPNQDLLSTLDRINLGL